MINMDLEGECPTGRWSAAMEGECPHELPAHSAEGAVP